MSRFSYLLNRLQRLEPTPARITPWPPAAHTFTYQLWVACGKPEERQSYWQMYAQMAKDCWKDQNDKN
jgi:hypothetical protein